MINTEIQDIYEVSNHEVILHLGERFRDYRKALGLTQRQIAFQSGVSIMTIVRFEKGQGGAIRLDNLIALMRAIQRLEDIEELIPEMPQSLYAKKRRNRKPRIDSMLLKVIDDHIRRQVEGLKD